MSLSVSGPPETAPREAYADGVCIRITLRSDVWDTTVRSALKKSEILNSRPDCK